MRIRYYLAFVLLWGQLAVADATAHPGQIDEIVDRHRAFAVSQLKDDDPLVASAALDALATLDDSYVELLREKLRLPITDPSLEVALKYFIKRATPNDLTRVKEIVAEAAKQGTDERKADPYIVDAALIEFLALEVLLASGNRPAVQFASTYLVETVERNPGPGLTQMNLALDLIGRFTVKSAAAKVKADAREELQFVALSALAMNGQQAALDTLKNRYKPGQKLEPYMMSDRQLIKKLGLTVEQLRAIYQTGSPLIQIVVAGQLAGMGHMDNLHEVTKRVLSKPSSESTINLVPVIGQFGDESFISDLDAIASKESALGKLWASRAIFQIVHRSKMAAPKDR